MKEEEVYNPNQVPLSDLWLYDPAGSPPAIPSARRIGIADLMVTRIEGIPGWAQRLVVMFGHCLRYCHERRKWLVWWDGPDCWRWDVSGGEALAMAAETVHETYRQARYHGRDREEKAALKMLLVRELRDILVVAQHSLRIPLADLDSNFDQLAVRNGVVNLATGELTRNRPEYFITKQACCDYDPSVNAPTWEAFLRTSMGSDHRVLEAVREYLGYSLTGHVSSKASFLVVGAADTGKSTMLGCFFKLLGDYAAKISIETLMRGAEHSNNALADLADLRGSRFVVTSEVDKGHRLNVSRFKAICQGGGGLPIKAALKYENPQVFAESHKLWIDANYRPIVPADDQAIFNRLIVLPFDNVIPRERQDEHLKEKLEAEFTGILSWAARGAARWYGSRSLPRPPAIAAASASYRSAMDHVSQFLEDTCELDSGETVGSTALYNAFLRWAQQQGIRPISQKKVITTLKERGFSVTKGRESNAIDGIRLL